MDVPGIEVLVVILGFHLELGASVVKNLSLIFVHVAGNILDMLAVLTFHLETHRSNSRFIVREVRSIFR